LARSPEPACIGWPVRASPWSSPGCVAPLAEAPRCGAAGGRATGSRPPGRDGGGHPSSATRISSPSVFFPVRKTKQGRPAQRPVLRDELAGSKAIATTPHVLLVIVLSSRVSRGIRARMRPLLVGLGHQPLGARHEVRSAPLFLMHRWPVLVYK
jgi:hypothetical protein